RHGGEGAGLAAAGRGRAWHWRGRWGRRCRAGRWCGGLKGEGMMTESVSTDRYTLRLRAAAEPEFSAATGHRFARELAGATIPAAVFRRYLVQDYSFLEHFIRLIDAAIATAPEAAARQRYVDFRAAVTSDENTYFLRSFEALNIPES